MNCQDIVEMLDGHAFPRTNSAQKSAVDSHLADCESCSDHWHAQQALTMQELPAVGSELLAKTRRLVAAQSSVPRSRGFSWRFVLGAGVLAGGAALAALGVITQSERSSDAAVNSSQSTRPSTSAAAEDVRAPSGTASVPPGTARAPSGPAPAAARGASLASGTDASDQATLYDGDYFALLKVPPQYPPEAVTQGLEGSVVVEFTVTTSGTVDDLVMVESTHQVFESAALDAVEQFKYMPRVTGGEPVSVTGVRNKITFVLEGAPVDPDALRKVALMGAPDVSMRPHFRQIVAPALDCVDAEDWRCAELVLDEANASYDFNPGELRALWNFYGYIFTRYEDYERAIAAYEKALSQPGYPGDAMQLTLAHLYFGRQQYGRALDTALVYIETASNPVPGAFQFVDALRRLGIVEQSR